MSKKQEGKKKKRVEFDLTPEETAELQMIVDRLRVQNPEGGSFESYLQSLRGMLHGREQMVSALVEELSKNPTKVGLKVFEMAQGMVQSGQSRRIIKQAAYRFSQRGLIADAEEPADDVVVLIQKESRKPLAHMTMGQGTLWVVSALIHEEGYQVPTAVAAFFDRDFGNLRVRVTESSSRLYKEFIQKIAGSLPSGKPCEVPLWHAARLFFELLDFSRSSQSNAGVEQARDLFRMFHNPERRPYSYDIMPQVEQPPREINQVNVEELLKYVDISWLLLPKDELLPFYEKLEELEKSPLVLPDEVKAERSRGIIKKAADALCVDKIRLLYQRYLEEQALWMKLVGRESDAMMAWIAAQHLGSLAAPSESPVVFEMIVLSLHHYWPEPEVKGKGDSEEGLYFQSDSGLILPR